MNDIDDEFINEAAPEKIITVKLFPWKYIALASSLALVVCIGLMVVLFGRANHDFSLSDSTSSLSEQKWEKKEVEKPKDDSDTAYDKLKSWKDMTLTEKYPIFSLLSQNDCQATNAVIDQSLIGEKLTYIPPEFYPNSSHFQFYPVNYYNPSQTPLAKDPFDHSQDVKNADVYEIKGFQYAYAVKFLTDEFSKGEKEYDNCYVYINTACDIYYLHELFESLNIKQYGSMNKAEYYTDDGRTIEFEGIDKQKILDILTNDSQAAEYVKNAEAILLKDDYKKRITLNTSIDALGIKNKAISVSDNGYLVTNLFMTAKVYNIGKEKAKELIDYVLNNYKGYELVYKDSDNSKGSSSSSFVRSDSSSSVSTEISSSSRPESNDS